MAGGPLKSSGPAHPSAVHSSFGIDSWRIRSSNVWRCRTRYGLPSRMSTSAANTHQQPGSYDRRFWATSGVCCQPSITFKMAPSIKSPQFQVRRRHLVTFANIASHILSADISF